MPLQIFLRRFARPPVGSQRRKFAHYESFDVRLRRFFVIKVRADVPDVRISEADDLAGIAGIGENFLVTREAGVENNFSAAARTSAGRAAVKYSSVFQREYRATCGLLRQCILQNISSRCRIYRGRIRERSKMIHRPVSKNRLAVNVRPAHRTKHPRIVRTIAVIAHHKIISRRNLHRAVARAVQIARRNVRFRRAPCRPHTRARRAVRSSLPANQSRA